MYSTHYERKFVIAERFNRTFKNKTYKCMTSISKNVYIYNLTDIVTKYNNTNHSTTKIKSADVKSGTYIDFNKENNKKDAKFEIAEYQNIKTFWQRVTFFVI